MGVSAGPDLIQDALIFHVDAADRNSYPGEGSTWFDLCPDSDNGAITNATFNSNGYFTFDGNGDYVEFTGGKIAPNLASTFTVSGWVFYSSTTDTRGWFACSNSDVSQNVGIELTSNSKVKAYINFDGGSAGPEMTTSFTNNVFFNCTLTSDNTTLTIYRNGLAEDTETRAGPGDFTGNMRLGHHPYLSGTNRFHQGGIAACQIFNRALTAKEVKQNFEMQRTRYGI